MNQFDENFFEFKITGGTKSTEIIQAEAIILKGPQKGESLPLKCQWFNITKTNDFLEIQGLSGAFYQPSMEDVGTKIMVQAVPILESQEYLGMPVFKETGYILQDPQIQETVTNILTKIGHLEIHCRLENTTVEALQVPQDLLITIYDYQVVVQCIDTNKTLYYPISEHYPQLKIQKKTTNGAELILCGVQNMHIKLQNNFTRDVVYLMMKTLRGKSFLAQSQISQVSSNKEDSELYAKVADYTTKIQQQDNEIVKLKQDLTETRQQLKDHSALSLNLQKTLDVVEKKYQELSKEMIDKNSIIEKQKKKLIFCEQEVNMIKTQLVSVEKINKKLMNSQQEMHQLDGGGIQEMIFKDKEEILNRHIQKLKEENNYLRVNYENQKLQIEEMLISHKQEIEEQELRQNEIQSLRKRCDSLAQEQSANKNRTETPQTPSPRSVLNTPIRFQCNQDSSDKEDEITRLKQQISNLEQTLKSLRLAYEQDIRAKQVGGVKPTTIGSSKQEMILQKLANDLAETITEKETALEHSKRINKDLVKRIQELESLLKGK